MPAPLEQLRDYLIDVLECSGDEAAERRLALRDQWRRTQASNAPFGAAPQPATSSDRAAEWAELEKVWGRFQTLPADATAELKPWLDSTWHDVQAAATRVVLVCKHRQRIIALWPKEIDRSLLDWLFELLVRPVSRRHGMQAGLEQALQASPATAKSFQKFSRRVRSELPDLEMPDLVSNAKATVQVDTQHAVKAPAPQMAANSSNSGLGTVAWVAIVIAGSVARFAMHSSPNPKPPPVRPLTTPTWNTPDQQRAYQDLMRTLQDDVRKRQPPLDPNDPTTRAAILGTQIITGQTPPETAKVKPYAHQLDQIREILDRQLNRPPNQVVHDVRAEEFAIGLIITAARKGPEGDQFMIDLKVMLDEYRDQARQKQAERSGPVDFPVDATRPDNAVGKDAP